MYCYRRRQGTSIYQGVWTGVGYGRIWNATKVNWLKNAKRSSFWQAGWPNCRNSRLIGRSLRAGVDRLSLGERQITIDCDVIQADGGTRCASITGGWVALRLAIDNLMDSNIILTDPLVSPVAAVSCGIYAGQPVLDLDYSEDSEAGVDGNFIMLENGNLIETQISAESATYSRDQLNSLIDLAEKGTSELFDIQRAARH